MSLKDALKKAGFKSSTAVNEREKKPEKKKTSTELHQEERNYCEICDLFHRDVEHFAHRNATIDARWICLNCADKAQIHDDFRTTAQSDFSKKGMYRRFYGPTKNMNDFKDRSKPGSTNPYNAQRPVRKQGRD